jgi:sugar phosphate isomerase/epimerase
MTWTRRSFLGGTAAVLAAGALRADPLGMPIGCQTYPVRDALGKDFEGTLKQIAAIGYKSIEMCSPPGYRNAGYGSLVDMKPDEMKKKIHAAGLRCESCHFQFSELKDHLDERIAFARDLGLKQMVLSTFGVRNDAPLSAWTEAAQELNQIAKRVQQSGMLMGFHNHQFEFREIDGVLVYDHLMQTLDPALVKMQFQVSVVGMGYQAATYLDKYPGRFLSLHLQDWSPTEKKEVAVGQGIVDWKGLFTAAKTGGIRNFFVELDMEKMKTSYTYLHALKV